MRYHKRMFSLRNICAKKTWHFLFSFPNRIIFYNHIKFKDFEMFFSTFVGRCCRKHDSCYGRVNCYFGAQFVPFVTSCNSTTQECQCTGQYPQPLLQPLPHQLLKNCSWSQLILILNGVLFLDSKRIAASPPNGSVRKRVVIEIIKINYQHIIHTA